VPVCRRWLDYIEGAGTIGYPSDRERGVEKCPNPTHQVHRVRSREEVEKGDVRVRCEIDARVNELPPGHNLPGKEENAQACGDCKATTHLVKLPQPPTLPPPLEADAAEQEYDRIRPQD
jgi:hypothetical protein